MGVGEGVVGILEETEEIDEMGGRNRDGVFKGHEEGFRVI